MNFTGMLKEGSLQDKVILITGGGTGLGKSMGKYFMELGANLIITSRKQDVLDKTAKEFSDYPGEIMQISGDVRNAKEVKQIIETALEKFGEINVVVNNAAGNFISPTERLSTKAFDVIVDIVLKGTYNYSLVLGKYLAVVLFFTSMLFMIALLPLSLIVETKADTGLMLSGMLGLSLLMLSDAAIGLFMSTLSRNPGIAAISTFVVLFVFWIIHMASNSDNDRVAEIIGYLSMQRHYQNMVSGMFSSTDVVFYLLLSSIFVLLSIWQLKNIRAYH